MMGTAGACKPETCGIGEHWVLCSRQFSERVFGMQHRDPQVLELAVWAGKCRFQLG